MYTWVYASCTHRKLTRSLTFSLYVRVCVCMYVCVCVCVCVCDSSAQTRYFIIRKGEKFALQRKQQLIDLSQELLASGAWRGMEVKEYNFKSLGVPPSGGHLHPLLKVRTQFREIFLQMGFEEMPTNNFVESSFWNFDALFQPQMHPARDAHDTFFISGTPCLFPISQESSCPNLYVHMCMKCTCVSMCPCASGLVLISVSESWCVLHSVCVLPSPVALCVPLYRSSSLSYLPGRLSRARETNARTRRVRQLWLRV